MAADKNKYGKFWDSIEPRNTQTPGSKACHCARKNVEDACFGRKCLKNRSAISIRLKWELENSKQQRNTKIWKSFKKIEISETLKYDFHQFRRKKDPAISHLNANSNVNTDGQRFGRSSSRTNSAELNRSFAIQCFGSFVESCERRQY